MRPRLVPRMGCGADSRMLLVGPRFNEAAVGTADGRHVGGVQIKVLNASMRPRLVPRMGAALPRRSAVRSSSASMRPRLVPRMGRAAPERPRGEEVALQ